MLFRINNSWLPTVLLASNYVFFYFQFKKHAGFTVFSVHFAAIAQKLRIRISQFGTGFELRGLPVGSNGDLIVGKMFLILIFKK